MDSPLPATVPYRCVCGEVFTVDTKTGGCCPACQRRIGPKAFSGGLAETASFRMTDNDGSVPAETVDAETLDDQIGRRYGHYRVVRKLGQGGMGAVYEALDESLQRYVALKVIHTSSHSATNTAQIERLLQEAIAQARVNHPNVVHIYFVGREEKTPFFAMELVPGPTLEDRLRKGPLPFPEVIAIAEQIAGALGHAADFDIVHGDVKPSNVLTFDARAVKLADFGLARRLSQIDEAPTVVAGTPNYLSPEAAQGKPLDIRSDIYSLGITLFELTFGRLPYSLSGDNIREFAHAHCTAAVEFPETWPADVPEGWRDVLARLLAKLPEDRYQNYSQVLEAVRRFRPVTLPPAGRVQRGFAWMVDLALAHAVQGIFYGRLADAVMSNRNWFASLILVILGALVPALAAVMQSRWKTTPGKRLFQLRIVDRHGMTPRKSALVLRSVFQYLPLWASSVFFLNMTVGREVFAAGLAAVAIVWLALDAASALYRRGFSLHDWLLRTQVVLDAVAAPETPSRDGV